MPVRPVIDGVRLDSAPRAGHRLILRVIAHDGDSRLQALRVRWRKTGPRVGIPLCNVKVAQPGTVTLSKIYPRAGRFVATIVAVSSAKTNGADFPRPDLTDSRTRGRGAYG